MKDSKGSVPRASWVTMENGYDRTNSPALIKNILTGLKNSRIFINISHQGYQSGNTIVVGFTAQHLKIDKPLDWPGKSNQIRIDFRDEARLANLFRVKVLSATEDTLVTTMPAEIFRLQQRENYRVDVPQGSTVTFSLQEERFDGYAIQNISAGGILFCTKKPLPLEKGAVLNNIRMLMISTDGGGVIIKVRQGEIVRSFHDRELGLVCFGVALKPKPLEEDALVKYVRQREIEILGKGIG